MVKIKCQIKGLDSLDNKINTIIKKLPQTIEQGIEAILKQTKTCAIRLERGNKEDGIIYEMIDVSNNKIKGRVYADPSKFENNGQSYLWFEYFGTGQYAEQNHIGVTKHFIESGYTQWFIPVDKVGRTLNYPIININDNLFYLARGVKANHFLGDAEFEMRDSNIETIKTYIKEMFMEVCK